MLLWFSPKGPQMKSGNQAQRIQLQGQEYRNTNSLTVLGTTLFSLIYFYNFLLLGSLYPEVLETGCALKIIHLPLCSES